MIPGKVTFEDFWSLYPRRVARAAALKAWKRLSPEVQLQAFSALIDWERIWRRRGEPEFIPHASTWLNGERWQDELPAAFAAAKHPSHLPAPIAPAAADSGPIPDHVKAVLERIRAKSKA